MARINLSFTKDDITLIRAFNIESFKMDRFGVDAYSLWGGTYIWEQMAYILGYADCVDPDTVEDPMGAQYREDVYIHVGEDGNEVHTFDKEEAEKNGWEHLRLREYLKERADYLCSHLRDIEEIVHQFCFEGVKSGVTYTCQDYQRIWHIKEGA